jgi:site-specific recombinase XerD
MRIKETPLETARRSFLLDRQAGRCTRATLYWYERYTGELLRYFTERQIADPGEVTATHLREYLIALQDRGLADRTVHHHASAARAFFNFCVAEDIIHASPMTRVRMPKLPKELLPSFSQEDVNSILKACETERDKAIVLCLLDTGARLQEFVGLQVGNVDLVDGKVTIKQGKGKKDRVTFLGEQSRRALRRYLATRPVLGPAAPLWLTERDPHGISVKGFQHLLQRLRDRSGVAHCHAHTFRRTFALTSLRAGMDLVSLRRLMGHTDTKVLERYLDQNEDDLRQAHREHGAVDRLLSKRG